MNEQTTTTCNNTNESPKHKTEVRCKSAHTVQFHLYKEQEAGACPGGGAWEWTQGLRDAGQGLFLDLGVGYICVFKWYSNFT